MASGTTERPSPVLRMGAQVEHAVHGRGEVVAVLRAGRAGLVRFPKLGALDIHVPARELVLLDAPPTGGERATSNLGERAAAIGQPPGSCPPAIASPPEVSAAHVNTLQLVEALRLGVVPAEGLDLYTVGREREVAAVDADLAAVMAGRGAACVVLGDYGTGKTHLLEHIAARARAQGFLVGHTALDPVDVPASNPRRVYRGLIQDLVYPSLDVGRGLVPLLELARGHAAVKARFLSGEGHAYLTPALTLLNRIDETEAEPVLDWLSGAAQDYTPELNQRYRLYGKRALPALMDYRPWAHIYAYLLSGLAALAHSVGHAGLVILLDEAEFFRVLSGENRAFAERLFRALVAAALPAGELPFSPEEEPRGGRGEFKTLPHRFTGHCPLYVVVAMTPTSQGDDLLSGLVRPERHLELTPLDAEAYRELARRVVLLYATRHESLRPKVDALSQLIGDLMFKGLKDGSFSTPRMAVKFVLELLDMSRLAPDRVRTAVDEIKRLWY